MRFIRKVYLLFLCQLLSTVLVAWRIMQSPKVLNWVFAHPWPGFYVPLILMLLIFIVLLIFSEFFPCNLLLLAIWTLFEAYGLGVSIAQYDPKAVFQALVITSGIFFGLTMFTIQSKWDFSYMGTYLFALLLFMFFATIVSIFIPFPKPLYILYACLGVLLFSCYIIYDTHQIMNKLTPNEYVRGAICLYLDFILL